MDDYLTIIPEKLWHIGMPSIFSYSFEQPSKVKIGIDVQKHKEDIKLIFYKRQASNITKEGLDPEDVLQEVYKGILIRNKGNCPYDPRKSALSTYIVMVMDCIIMNIVNKHRRDKERFEFGSEEDVAISHDSSYEEDTSSDIFIGEIRKSFKEDQLKVFDALTKGFKMSHIAKMFGWEARKVSKLKKEIQQTVAVLIDRKDLIPC